MRTKFSLGNMDETEPDTEEAIRQKASLPIKSPILITPLDKQRIKLSCCWWYNNTNEKRNQA